MEKMWSGRFAQDASTLLEQFNASIQFDQKLYREDIEGSVAHVITSYSIHYTKLYDQPVQCVQFYFPLNPLVCQNQQ